MTSGRLSMDRFGLGSSLPIPGGGPLQVDPVQSLLPKLAHETELQKMLTDEKMRAEQHRTNYQTIKVEHTRLQDEYMTLQTELRSTIEESKLVQEKYKSILEQLRKDLSDKQAENDQLKSQSLNPQKLEMLRIQLTDELEKPYRAKYQRMDEEVEKYRTEYNKLKYEFSFLKSEYEHERVESQCILEELKMRHEAEVMNLRRERETVIGRQQTDSGTDGQRLRGLQRENTQLQLKLKGVLSELAEVRAEKEHSGLQTDNVTRLQNKQLIENQATIKSMETERESLKSQVTSLQKELAATNSLQTQLTSKINDLEKENIQLRGHSEETTHKAKVELTNCKMDMLKERGVLERERDHLSNDIEELKCQIDILKHSLETQSESLVEKEREAVKRVQAAREEEWQKLHAVENEKLDLETKLQALERSKIDEESLRHAQSEKAEEKLRQISDEKLHIEKQLLVVKTKQQHQEALLDTLEKERSENSDLKSRLHRIESAYNSYVGTERELIDNNSVLKRQVQELSSELQRTRDQLQKATDSSELLIAQNQAAWAEEKSSFQRRIDELDDQLSSMSSQISTLVASHGKKKKKYTNLITRLKHKLTVTQAKMEELSIEREALKKSVPSAAHFQLKKQLKELMSRHRDFRMLMLTSDMNQVNIGNMPFAEALPNADLPVGALEMEKQHQHDLELLKERLDTLDHHQKHQLQELKGISPSHSPRLQLDDIEPPMAKDDLCLEIDSS